MKENISSLTEQLRKAFLYTFVENVPYAFFIPKADKYVAVNLQDKIYHCEKCSKEVVVRYHNPNGVIYFSKGCLAAQRKNYDSLGKDFPSMGRLEGGEPFTNWAIGCCSDCAEREILPSIQPGQRIYNLCETMHRADENLLLQAGMQIGELLQQSLCDPTFTAEASAWELPDLPSVCNLICSIILQRTDLLAPELEAYQKLCGELTAEAQDLLKTQPDAWKAYTMRPTDLYESMSDELYHEYTVAFPQADTLREEFYLYRSIEKKRVKLFLEQPRIASMETLLLETGIQPQWVQWFEEKGIGPKG